MGVTWKQALVHTGLKSKDGSDHVVNTFCDDLVVLSVVKQKLMTNTVKEKEEETKKKSEIERTKRMQFHLFTFFRWLGG